jgi:hypothetical protein
MVGAFSIFSGAFVGSFFVFVLRPFVAVNQCMFQSDLVFLFQGRPVSVCFKPLLQVLRKVVDVSSRHRGVLASGCCNGIRVEIISSIDIRLPLTSGSER